MSGSINFKINTAGNVWIIPHGLGTHHVLIDVDVDIGNGELRKIIPAQFTVLDWNHIRVDFDEPHTGFCRVIG